MKTRVTDHLKKCMFFIRKEGIPRHSRYNLPDPSSSSEPISESSSELLLLPGVSCSISSSSVSAFPFSKTGIFIISCKKHSPHFPNIQSARSGSLCRNWHKCAGVLENHTCSIFTPNDSEGGLKGGGDKFIFLISFYIRIRVKYFKRLNVRIR